MDGNNDVTDRLGHGTHVGGIIAANPDNGRGVAGVCWWSCRLIAEKVVSDEGTGTNAQLAAGIRHAVSRGARVLNMSLGSRARSETVVQALYGAWEADRVAVAAAGNDHTDKKSYPGAYHTEHFTSWFGTFPRDYYTPNLTVAAVDDDDRRASFSNYGSWVDLAAPGVTIMSTVPNSSAVCPEDPDADYCPDNGTSMATPIVAATAALVRTEHPGWFEDAVRRRVLMSAHRIADTRIGGRRVDVAEALMNLGFETGNLAEWSPSGTASVVSSLGPIRPPDRSRKMALISTGPGSTVTSSTLTKVFQVIPGDEDFELRFRYNFLSEEYPEWVNQGYNDDLVITLVTEAGQTIPVAFESVDTTGWTPVTGIDFPGGDSTVGQSGWRSARISVPIPTDVPGAPSPTTLRLVISDRGDSIYDSVVLFDDVHLE